MLQASLLVAATLFTAEAAPQTPPYDVQSSPAVTIAPAKQEQTTSVAASDGVQGSLAGIRPEDGRFRTGAGFYYIRPHWNNNPAYARFVAGSGQQVQNFEYDYSFAPRVWAGYTFDDGLGVRARWWSFSQHDRQAAQGDGQILTAGPQGLSMVRAYGADSPLYVDGDLNLQSIDLEATKDVKVGAMSLLCSAGVRYAHLSQDYSAFEPGPTAAQNQALVSGHNLNGFGPTIGIEDRYPLGGGFAMIGGLRGSLLFGQAKQSARLQSTLLDSSASERQDSILPVGELEVGGEYGVDVGSAHLFVQLTLVGQVWAGAGNNSKSSAPSAATGLPSAADSDNLGFFGLSATTGVRW